ncbi:transcriptional regulator [Clostridium sp. YIM B02505]|uniref:Transcriptional regulator n=1 Tax=Clostridium yunnanense TaxID=2800325 RepID=A0ABS1ESM4_9CLOT|nr:transcriptional regulator [Clostridium yunnanense]MBK1812298.1 transcriptional regulator [Clostridium yunnanense]
MVEKQAHGTDIDRCYYFETCNLVLNQRRTGVTNTTREGGYYNVN